MAKDPSSNRGDGEKARTVAEDFGPGRGKVVRRWSRAHVPAYGKGLAKPGIQVLRGDVFHWESPTLWRWSPWQKKE